MATGRFITQLLLLLSALATLQVTTVQAKVCCDDVCEYKLLISMDYRSPDGFTKAVYTINGQCPGPVIEVVLGKRVIVHVNNQLNYITSIHFHGQRQKNSWFMDGATLVTMYPMSPNSTFTHDFIANPVGTHWYHEHARLVYADCLYGMFIVHPKCPKPPQLPEFRAAVDDWQHVPVDSLYGHFACPAINPTTPRPPGVAQPPGCYLDGTNMRPQSFVSALWGFKGRFGGSTGPLTTYTVTPGQTYKFRLLNSGFWFPLEVSIDGHKVTIIASDGADIQPVTVDSFTIFVGERMDFTFTANQAPGNYWIRARPFCIDDAFSARAIIQYAGQPAGDPTSTPTPCTAAAPCTEFNCRFGQYPPSYYTTCINFDQVHSTMTPAKLKQQWGVGESNVDTYFLNFAMSQGGVISGRRFTFPPVPYYADPKQLPCAPGQPCENTCDCLCLHTIKLKYGRNIQFVVSNIPETGYNDDGAHTVHFHGYPFAVVAQRFAPQDPVTGVTTSDLTDIDCGSYNCWNAKWNTTFDPSVFNKLDSYPIKDTLNVPKGGYVVIRFKSDNPGPFMLHCHLDGHIAAGMSLIVDTDGPGKDGAWPKPPPFWFPQYQTPPCCNGAVRCQSLTTCVYKNYCFGLTTHTKPTRHDCVARTKWRLHKLSCCKV